MKCPACSYIFSEELRICPRCHADVGGEFEKIGYFPPAAKEPFLRIEDLRETMMEEVVTKSEPSKREIEFNFKELSEEMKDLT